MSKANSNVALAAPVAEVTLLEDRARVIRRGQCALVAGKQRVVVEAVAPVIVDKTVQCRVTGAKVLDARVRRRSVAPGEGGSEVEALRDEAREAHFELSELYAKRDVLGKASTGLDELMAHSIGDLAVDVTWGAEPGAEWRTRIESARAERERVVTDTLKLENEIREREEALARLNARIGQLSSPSESEFAVLEIDLECPSTSDARFEIEYLVPNACWRPYHRAEWTSSAPDTMQFHTDACVWQNTGEDWSGVQLTLSTERASLGVQPPLLATDELRTRRKSDDVVVEARDEVVDMLAPHEPGAPQKQAAPDVPGIDDGGEVRKLQPADPATLPSDGRPHRIALSSQSPSCRADLLAVPELAPLVYRRVLASNEASDPILAGPVDLILDGGHAGRTSTLYIAAGERFELSFGPLASLRVHREAEQLDDQGRMLSSWVSREYVARLRISNLGQSEHQVHVRERIPVSEIDKVEIEVDEKKTSPGHSVDDNGFVDWVVDLAPRAHESLELRYRIRRHDSVKGLQ